MLTKLSLVLTFASSFVAASMELPTNTSSTRHLGAQGSCYKMQFNTDLIGNDIIQMSEILAENCADYCDRIDMCGMTTWTKYSGGTCFLKKSVVPTELPRAAYVKGARSLIYVSPCRRVDATLGNCAMVNPKYELKAERAALPKHCYGICAGTPKCYAFTWTPLGGGTCNLKTDISECVPAKKEIESGVIFT